MAAGSDGRELDMTNHDRFAPPRAKVEQVAGDADDLWREGKVLVMRRDGTLPHRCIKCNAPSVAPTRRYKLTWHSPWWYLLLLMAVLLYALVAMLVRKTAVVHIGLCERHQRRVLWGRLVGWGGFALLVALFGAAYGFESGGAAVAGFLLLLPWAIATISVNRQVLPVRIDDRYVRLKGCGPDFLRSLPDRTWS
jgi:hypothetical protein